MSNFLNYSDQQIEALINDVYSGVVTRDNLPVDLYEDIKRRLNKGVFEGFGGSYENFSEDTTEGLIMSGFEKNIAVFSGAKTFQQVNDMSNFLFAGSEKLPFSEFKKHANEIFDTYNDNWLKTEYNTAISQASSGRQWNDIKNQADIFPLIKFITVGDGRVRDSHKGFDNIVKPIGDPFWKKYFPPLDWNCRCTTEQLEEGDEPITDIKGRNLPEVPKLFQMNAGEDKIIFDESVHPYFKVDQRYKVALKNNFDLPFVPEVKPKGVKPVKKPKVPVIPEPAVQGFVPAKSIKDAEAYALEKLGVKFAEYKGIPLEVVNDMNKSLFETLEKFPALKMNGIGSAQNINVKIKAYIKEQVIQSQQYKELVANYGERYGERLIKNYTNMIKPVKSGTLAYSTNYTNRKALGAVGVDLDLAQFNGVYINKTAGMTKDSLDEIVKRNVENGWFAKGGEDFGYIMTHEFGHEIDKLLGLKVNPEFDAIFKREHANGLDAVAERLSRYGATAGKIPSHRRDEMIAEAWAEYLHSKNPRELSRQIGELIEKEYKKYYK